MTDQSTYLLMATLLMAAATLFTRIFPFALFSRRQPPAKLLRSARLIPGAVMTILVLTSLPLTSSNPDNWIPWLSVGTVAGLHIAFRHPLISIFGGTALYMVLLHFFGQ